MASDIFDAPRCRSLGTCESCCWAPMQRRIRTGVSDSFHGSSRGDAGEPRQIWPFQALGEAAVNHPLTSQR